MPRPPGDRARVAVLAVALAAVLVAVSACMSTGRAPSAGATSAGSSTSAQGSASDQGSPPAEGSAAGEGSRRRGGCVVAAAGDIAGPDDNASGARRTARLIASARPEAVLALGDLAYDDGTVADFADFYDPTWGRFKDITLPTPGNHEYGSDGKGYFDYFDVAPNYAVDVCGWRLVSVDPYAGMGKAAAFITREGAAARGTPLLVFWHEPRFSSGSEHGSTPDMQPLWAAAAGVGADVVLGAHDHDYERFGPMDANGNARPGGTVEFVVGTGGHHLRPLGRSVAYSATALEGTPGVLFLTLRADGYDWSYRDVKGRTGDSGTRRLP